MGVTDDSHSYPEIPKLRENPMISDSLHDALVEIADTLFDEYDFPPIFGKKLLTVMQKMDELRLLLDAGVDDDEPDLTEEERIAMEALVAKYRTEILQ